jgi:hypothetical protein
MGVLSPGLNFSGVEYAKAEYTKAVTSAAHWSKFQKAGKARFNELIIQTGVAVCQLTLYLQLPADPAVP